jgi:hypothetical protein
MKELQFSWETFLVADGSSSVYQGPQHRMLIGHVVVWLSIYTDVAVGGLLYTVYPKYSSDLSRKGRWLFDSSLHGGLDVGMDVTKVVKGIIQPFWSMMPYHKCVIHVIQLTSGLVGCPTKCHLLEVLHEENGNYRWQQWAHGNSDHLFAKLTIETEEQTSADVVEQFDFGFIKLLTQKIRWIPKCHPHEKWDDTKADMSVIWLNLECVHCMWIKSSEFLTLCRELSRCGPRRLATYCACVCETQCCW